jgi:hypothetical protein
MRRAVGDRLVPGRDLVVELEGRPVGAVGVAGEVDAAAVGVVGAADEQDAGSGGADGEVLAGRSVEGDDLDGGAGARQVDVVVLVEQIPE